jgi:hypothetical protein
MLACPALKLPLHAICYLAMPIIAVCQRPRQEGRIYIGALLSLRKRSTSSSGSPFSGSQ